MDLIKLLHNHAITYDVPFVVQLKTQYDIDVALYKSYHDHTDIFLVDIPATELGMLVGILQGLAMSVNDVMRLYTSNVQVAVSKLSQQESVRLARPHHDGICEPIHTWTDHASNHYSHTVLNHVVDNTWAAQAVVIIGRDRYILEDKIQRAMLDQLMLWRYPASPLASDLREMIAKSNVARDFIDLRAPYVQRG